MAKFYPGMLQASSNITISFSSIIYLRSGQGCKDNYFGRLSIILGRFSNYFGRFSNYFGRFSNYFGRFSNYFG